MAGSAAVIADLIGNLLQPDLPGRAFLCIINNSFL